MPTFPQYAHDKIHEGEALVKSAVAVNELSKERFYRSLENRQMAEDEYREQCARWDIAYECPCTVNNRTERGRSMVPPQVRRVFG